MTAMTSTSPFKRDFTTLPDLLQHASKVDTYKGNPVVITGDGRLFIGRESTRDGKYVVFWEEQDFHDA